MPHLQSPVGSPCCQGTETLRGLDFAPLASGDICLTKGASLLAIGVPHQQLVVMVEIDTDGLCNELPQMPKFKEIQVAAKAASKEVDRIASSLGMGKKDKGTEHARKWTVVDETECGLFVKKLKSKTLRDGMDLKSSAARDAPKRLTEYFTTKDGEAFARAFVTEYRVIQVGNQVSSVAFSPNGELLAVASLATDLPVFKVATGDRIMVASHYAGVRGLSWNPAYGILPTWTPPTQRTLGEANPARETGWLSNISRSYVRFLDKENEARMRAQQVRAQQVQSQMLKVPPKLSSTG